MGFIPVLGSMTKGSRNLKDWDLEIDALGLLCPLPVLRLRKRMEPLRPGQVARLLADDPASQIDVPHFCTESGHGFLGQDEEDGRFIYYVQKADHSAAN